VGVNHSIVLVVFVFHAILQSIQTIILYNTFKALYTFKLKTLMFALNIIRLYIPPPNQRHNSKMI